MGQLAASPYVVIGAGMHGLSTAYHLALELERRGSARAATSSSLDKATPGAGATGIACGVVRNNYFQPAMSELMQACVEVWESDPEAYHYNGVGYIALGPPVQEPDLVAVYERQERIGYRSELIVGEAEVDAHMKRLFPDWRAKGVTVCLHEHQGGFAFNLESVAGLRDKCLAEGVRILRAHGGDRVRARRRRRRRRRRDEPRADRRSASRSSSPPARGRRSSGRCSASPTGSTSTRRRATSRRDQPMWTYWNLQEGEITVDPLTFATADGGAPPVIHLDTDAPLYTDDGRLVTDELWGIYYKRDRHGVQGGAVAAHGRRRRRARPVPVDHERRPGLPGHVVRGALARDGALRGLPRALQDGPLGRRRRVHRGQLPGLRLGEAERLRDPRLEPRLQDDRRRPRGREGRCMGEHAPLLYPFRFERFATGDLHPVSNSPYPWSKRGPCTAPPTTPHRARRTSVHAVRAAARGQAARMARCSIILLLGFAPWLIAAHARARALPDRHRAARAPAELRLVDLVAPPRLPDPLRRLPDPPWLRLLHTDTEKPRRP